MAAMHAPEGADRAQPAMATTATSTGREAEQQLALRVQQLQMQQRQHQQRILQLQRASQGANAQTRPGDGVREASGEAPSVRSEEARAWQRSFGRGRQDVEESLVQVNVDTGSDDVLTTWLAIQMACCMELGSYWCVGCKNIWKLGWCKVLKYALLTAVFLAVTLPLPAALMYSIRCTKAGFVFDNEPCKLRPFLGLAMFGVVVWVGEVVIMLICVFVITYLIDYIRWCRRSYQIARSQRAAEMNNQL